MFTLHKMMITALLGGSVLVSACSTEQVLKNIVDATGFVAKTAVKGPVGAGKLAVKGVKAATADTE